MTPSCPSCGAQSKTWTLCKPCTAQLLRNLDALPGLLEDLDTARVKLTRFHGQGRHRRHVSERSTDEPTLPWDERASQAWQAITNMLATWVRDLHPNEVLEVHPCVWLTQHVEDIRAHDAVEQIVGDIADAVKRAARLVDRPPDAHPTISAGACPVCGHGLWHEVGMDAVLCRQCIDAGLPGSRRLVDLLADRLPLERHKVMPLSEVGTWMVALGLLASRDTPRKWVERGRLTYCQLGADGRPLYRLGDALAIRGGRRKHGA